MEELKKQARAGNERSMKLRAGHEKDKRILEAQIEKLTKALETKDAEASLEAKKIEAQHQAEIKALQRKIAEVTKEQEADRRAYEKARDAAVGEVDDWCRGEIEAVRFEALDQINKAKAESQRWMIKHDEEITSQNDLKQRLDQESNQVQSLQEDLDARLAEIESVEATARALSVGFESERLEWQARIDKSNALRIEELISLKATHRSQLELVDSRLQQVVSKKDASIQQLKMQLSEMSVRLRMFEGLVGEEGETGRSYFQTSDQMDARLTDPRLRKSTGGGILPSFNKASGSLLDGQRLCMAARGGALSARR